MADVLAYLITMRGYGTWLHGDERGSTDSDHHAYDSPPIAPEPALELMAASRLKTPPVLSTNLVEPQSGRHLRKSASTKAGRCWPRMCAPTTSMLSSRRLTSHRSS